MSELQIVVQNLLTKLASGFANSFWSAFLLTVIFLIGYIIGCLFKKIVVKLLSTVRLQDWLEEQNLASIISAKTLSNIFGNIIEWSIILLSLAQGAEVLGYSTLRSVLLSVIQFAYSCIFALIIGLAGLMVARYVRNFLESTLTRFKSLIGLGVELLIIYMTAVMALKVVPGIDTTILEWAFIIGFGSIAFAMSLAIGISFGLALKDDAKNIIGSLETKKSKKSRSKTEKS